MRSYLDTIRKPVNFPLLQDEKVLKYYTASYDVGSSLASSWRLGNLYLTNERLLFVQGRKILFGVLLNQIKTINIVKRKWILGKKVKQLNIVSQDRRVPYIAIKEPENWKRAIEERTQESQSTPSDPQPTAHNPQHNVGATSRLRDEVILKEKGGYLSPEQSRWRLGTLLLTCKKLAFLQPTGIVWETPLSSIKDLRIEKRVYGVSKSDTICVVYERKQITEDRKQKTENRSQIRKVWIISPNLETWRKKLKEVGANGRSPLLKVDGETLNKIATELDVASKKIIWFLYEQRHARINTLAELIKAPTHMDVLLKIKDTINPTAEKIIGHPILSFETSKVDRETGENVTFSWWLAGQPKRTEREPLLDIFDENGNIVVYLELLGLKEEDKLQLSVANNKLIIDTDKDYHKEILLPAVVDTNSFTKKYKNNILEVRLKKANVGGIS